jgi:iron(III) transport system ATP-binding protein
VTVGAAGAAGAADAAVVVRDLRKAYAGRGRPVMAVDGVSFEVEPGSMFTLLGPSGCGKTTTLRCVAGLERPDSGTITVAGRTLFDGDRRVNVRADERGLGMVFQSYAIWPHMDVFANVAFPLRVGKRSARVGRAEVRRRVEEALATVQLSDLAGRPATDLSGGQQQRLALARALVMRPPVLLLDEPLSNLDAKLREEMRFELKSLQRRTGITALYVTHDQVEALAMSNRVAVVRAGRIEQVGRPREIYERPATRFVAGFIGTANFLDGTVRAREPGQAYLVATAAGELYVGSEADHAVGATVTVAVRPERVALEKGHTPSPRPGSWNGTVTARAFLGEAVDHVVDVSGVDVKCRCNPAVSIPPGEPVTLTFAENGASLLPAQ